MRNPPGSSVLAWDAPILVHRRNPDNTGGLPPASLSRDACLAQGLVIRSGKGQRTTVAGQAAVVRNRLLDSTGRRDAVASGLLGEALEVGRDRGQRLAGRVQQRGARLLDDLGLVGLERPDPFQYSVFQVAQELDVDVRVVPAQCRDSR